MNNKNLLETLFEFNDKMLVNETPHSPYMRYLSNNKEDIDLFGVIVKYSEGNNINENDILNIPSINVNTLPILLTFIFCLKDTKKIYSIFNTGLNPQDRFKTSKTAEEFKDIPLKVLQEVINSKNKNEYTAINNSSDPFVPHVKYKIYFNDKYKNNIKTTLIVNFQESDSYNLSNYKFSLYGFSNYLDFGISVYDDPSVILNFFDQKKICVGILDHERYLRERISNVDKEIINAKQRLVELEEKKKKREDILKNDKVREIMTKYFDESLFDNRELLKELKL